MYHIFDKSLLVCIIPSITIATSFGNLILAPALRLYIHLTIACFVAVGCGVTNQGRHLGTPAELESFNHWMASCFSITLL